MSSRQPEDASAQVKACGHVTRGGKMQEIFLNHCRKERIPVQMQLCDQTVMSGLIIGFDQQVVILEQNECQQMIYKSSLVCVKPQEVVNFIFNDAARYRDQLRRYPEYATHFS